MQEYIDGKKEISEILNETIAYYTSRQIIVIIEAVDI